MKNEEFWLSAVFFYAEGFSLSLHLFLSFFVFPWDLLAMAIPYSSSSFFLCSFGFASSHGEVPLALLLAMEKKHAGMKQSKERKAQRERDREDRDRDRDRDSKIPTPEILILLFTRSFSIKYWTVLIV